LSFYKASGKDLSQTGGTPKFLSINFTAATSSDSPGLFPPDTMGTVGPTQFFLTINGLVRSFSKNTGSADGALNMSLDTFFQSVEPSFHPNRITDPQVRYDPLSSSGHWFVTALGNDNRIELAVSGGPIITASDWRFYYFHPYEACGDSSTYFVDQPWLAFDAHSLYISGDAFLNPGTGYRAFVIDKNSLINTNNPIIYCSKDFPAFAGSGMNSPRGVTNYDPNATQGWFIGFDGSTNNQLILKRVTYDVNNVPTLGPNIPLTVNTFNAPSPNVPEPSAQRIGFLLNRQMGPSTIRSNGDLWTSHTVGVDNQGQSPTTCNGDFTDAHCRNALRWYHINVNGPTPVLIASDSIYDTTNPVNANYYIYGSVMISGQGQALFGMTVSGTSTNPSAAFTSLTNINQTPPYYLLSRYRIGGAPYTNPPGDGGMPLRWGDYSFTSLDPCDDMTMWTAQEYAASASSWGIQVAQVKAEPPSISYITPSTITQRQKLQHITIIGSNFYDPNIKSACKKSFTVQVSNAPVYNVSVSPTQIQFDVNTCSLQVATSTVTITNPDGQIATQALTLSNNGNVCPVDRPGVYRKSTGEFLLKTAFTGGQNSPPDIYARFGPVNPGNIFPVVGNWAGTGFDTLGVYDSTTGQFYLRDSNTSGPADHYLVLGIPGDRPLAGHWDSTMMIQGNPYDGVGVFRPSNGLIYLKKQLSTGFADYTMVFGIPNDMAIADDWNGDTIDSVGVFRTNGSPIFYLTNQVTNGPVINADYTIRIGSLGQLPVSGSWTSIGYAGIGVWDGIFYTKNLLVGSNFDNAFAYGNLATDLPIAGHWSATTYAAPNISSNLLVPNTPAPSNVSPTIVPILPTQPKPNNYDG